ncbi:MAG: amidohydrolase family protein [Marinilabiliales bacterium]|nr:amidohydrolase family protein [Marinilabiliales bacterium]
MDLLLLHIKELVQAADDLTTCRDGKEMAQLGVIRNAYLLIRDERIIDYGPMEALGRGDLGRKALEEAELLTEVDCSGRLVFPSFCDPDSHLLYPFAPFGSGDLQMNSGHGRKRRFFNSYEALHEMTADEIYHQALDHLKEVAGKGTGAIGIKSGYGLDAADEFKLLEVIRKLKQTTPLLIQSTFLGSHTFREHPGLSVSGYLDHLLNLLPMVAQDELADNMDVYCDNHFFTLKEAEMLLRMGLKHGLNIRIHSDELGFAGLHEQNLHTALELLSPGGEIDKDKIDTMVRSQLCPVIMPGASFFHNLSVSSAREMIDAGLTVALSTDFDPGAMPSCDMKFMQSLACIKYGMRPEEVINASTINSACLMGIGEGYGSISRGKAANLFVTKKIPSYQYFPYAFSSDLIEMVILSGEII